MDEKQSEATLLVGCGHMGGALLRKWQKDLEDIPFAVIQPSGRKPGISAGISESIPFYPSPDSLPDSFSPSLVILAIPPFIMADIVPLYRPLFQKGASFLSVAAGISFAQFAEWLGTAPPSTPSRLIRSMPNIPVEVGAGMTLSCATPDTDDKIRAHINRLLNCCGAHEWFEHEKDMDAVTAISGSGAGFAFHFIETLERAAIELGLAPNLARIMAIETIKGAAIMAAETGIAPDLLRQQVTSPGGTTQAGLAILKGKSEALQNLMLKTTRASFDRSIAMGKK